VSWAPDRLMPLAAANGAVGGTEHLLEMPVMLPSSLASGGGDCSVPSCGHGGQSAEGPSDDDSLVCTLGGPQTGSLDTAISGKQWQSRDRCPRPLLMAGWPAERAATVIGAALERDTQPGRRRFERRGQRRGFFTTFALFVRAFTPLVCPSPGWRVE